MTVTPCVFYSGDNHAYSVTHDLTPGWYWCIPGDRDPVGPFGTKTATWDDALKVPQNRPPMPGKET